MRFRADLLPGYKYQRLTVVVVRLVPRWTKIVLDLFRQSHAKLSCSNPFSSSSEVCSSSRGSAYQESLVKVQTMCLTGA